MKIPPPNLQGDYRGSCVVCLRGTDTAIAFTGEAEWLEAGLRVLGIPDGQARHTADQYWQERGADPGMVFDGEHTMTVKVCAECAARSGANFPAPGIPAFGVPNLTPAVRR